MESMRQAKIPLTNDTLHRVSFARWRLTIRKYRSIVSGQNVRHNRFCRFIVNLLLRCIRLEYFIEQIDLSLKTTENNKPLAMADINKIINSMASPINRKNVHQIQRHLSRKHKFVRRRRRRRMSKNTIWMYCVPWNVKIKQTQDINGVFLSPTILHTVKWILYRFVSMRTCVFWARKPAHRRMKFKPFYFISERFFHHLHEQCLFKKEVNVLVNKF